MLRFDLAYDIYNPCQLNICRAGINQRPVTTWQHNNTVTPCLVPNFVFKLSTLPLH